MKQLQSAMTIITAVAIVMTVASAETQTQTYQVDPAKSRATIHVGKAGAFSFIAGHSHEVSGPIQSGSVALDLDEPSRSRVQLTIAGPELKVSAEREPEGDAPKVQDAMAGEKVLDVVHHPRITYESTGITIRHRDGDRLDLTVTGRLTIRDVMREVAAPVHVELAGNTLTGTGRFSIEQSAFGIKPISVGGVVAVKDTLEIEFSVLAHR